MLLNNKRNLKKSAGIRINRHRRIQAIVINSCPRICLYTLVQVSKSYKSIVHIRMKERSSNQHGHITRVRKEKKGMVGTGSVLTHATLLMSVSIY